MLRAMLLAFVLLAAALTHASAEDYYRYPLSHQAFYPAEVVSESPKLVGKYGLVNVGIHTASKASPVVEDGVIYVGADSGTFYAINDSDLSVKWTFQVRKSAEEGIHCTAAIDDKHVFVGDYAGWLYAFDKATGRLSWQTELGESIGASPVIWDDRVCVGVETTAPDGFLSCVDRKTGKLLFNSPRFGDHTHSTPTIDVETGQVFLGANSSSFYGLNGANGKIQWSVKTKGEIKSTAALFDGFLLFTSWDGHLFKVSRKTGEVAWRFQTRDLSMSSPAVDPDSRMVFFGSDDGYLYAVGFDDGKEKWRFRTSGPISSSPVIVSRRDGAGKMVIFGSRDRFLYGLDEKTGARLWSFVTQGPVTGVPAIKNGRIYVSGDDGWLYVLQ
ncbi:MAG: PQQ-binding-like beta-propeller repeat protein [Syntrophobacteraceae bacterium]